MKTPMHGLRIVQPWRPNSALIFMNGLYPLTREHPLRRKRAMPDTPYLNLS
jgi:hypothetical protein